MYVRPISARFCGGRSTPAIRAITYPCLCLCFGFTQMTRTTPSRWITLHLSQIFFTDALTFISAPNIFERLTQLAQNLAAPGVIRRERHFHAVARNQPDEISFHHP